MRDGAFAIRLMVLFFSAVSVLLLLLVWVWRVRLCCVCASPAASLPFFVDLEAVAVVTCVAVLTDEAVAAAGLACA